MALSFGTRVDSYEAIAALGAGGMGRFTAPAIANFASIANTSRPLEAHLLKVFFTEAYF